MSDKLGVGFVGAGFITNFHIRAWQGVREANIAGIVSLTEDESQAAADNCRKFRVGDPGVFKSISEMVADPGIDAIWICAPWDKRSSAATAPLIGQSHPSGRISGRSVGIDDFKSDTKPR